MQRMRQAVAITGLAVLALLQLARLASALYLQLAEAAFGNGTTMQAVARAAAADAVALMPWDAAAIETQARLLLRNRDPSGGLEAFDAALRTAPADPYLWDGRAASLVAMGLYDDALAFALDRAGRLAPTAPPVQTWQADLALREWPHLPAATRAALLPSLRFMAAQNPTAFAAALLGRTDAADIRAALAAGA